MSSSTATGTAEFVGLMALLMSMMALAVDAMLPALSQMSQSLGVENPNDIQLVISTIFLGMALGLLLYGPLSDSFGRKKALYLGIGIYLFGTVIALVSTGFTVMLVGRVLQGFGCAALRVCTMAMIRDRFEGQEMGRIMSLIMMIFILVPALAPSAGQAILFFANWRAIFVLFLALGLIGWLWLRFRQPETLAPENRLPFSVATIWAGLVETLTHPVARGYTIAAGLMFGSFVGYLSSSQQILQEQYQLGEMFSIYFGVLALAIGLASYANSRLVARFKMETICLGALVVLCFSSALFYFYARGTGVAGHPALWLLMVYLAVPLFCMGILFGNLTTLAIQPLGHIAGVANSVISFVQTILSVVLGGAIGQLYDGTVLPLVLGFLVLGLASLAMTYYTRSRAQTVAAG